MQKHLKERGVGSRVRLLSVTEDVAVFPLYTLTGELVGYQNYRPNATKRKTNDPREARYFTKMRKRTVWGLEYLNPAIPVLFVVEGIFDAVKLIELGYNAIATLSNDPVDVGYFLWCLPYYKIAVCDNDTAGLELAQYCNDYITLSGVKDLGELSARDTDELAKNLIWGNLDYEY